MEDLKDKTRDLVDHVEDIADTFYKLTVLNVAQRATNVTSNLVAVILVGIFGFFFVLFGGIALSWWLGNLLENRTAGFLLGAAFFLIVMLVLVALRKKVIFPYFRDMFIRKFYE